MGHAETLINSILHRLDLAELMEEDVYDTIDHGELVGRLVRMLCDQMEYPDDFGQQVIMAAYLHDIGKLRLSKNIYGRDKNALEIEEANRAKWHLIECLSMTETEAHRYIEKQAMDLRISKREVAENIIKTYQ